MQTHNHIFYIVVKLGFAILLAPPIVMARVVAVTVLFLFLAVATTVALKVGVSKVDGMLIWKLQPRRFDLLYESFYTLFLSTRSPPSIFNVCISTYI